MYVHVHVPERNFGPLLGLDKVEVGGWVGGWVRHRQWKGEALIRILDFDL